MNEMEEIVFSEKFKIKIQVYLSLPKDYKIQVIPPNTYSYRIPRENAYKDIQLNRAILADLTGNYACGYDSRTNTLFLSLISIDMKPSVVSIDEFKGMS